MTIKIFQVDAFSSQVFGGNPAAVCPLESWLPDETLQKIALENNLSETAFFLPENDGYRLRWFTPAVEIDLCGHATLASAHILFDHLGYSHEHINFYTRSGLLFVKKNNNYLTLNFPKDTLVKIETPEIIKQAITVNPLACYKGKNILLVVLSSQKEIEELNPAISLLEKAHPHGVIFTSSGNKSDFVSRCFYPNCGVNEDPVTGSAHCTLTTFWSEQLGKNKFTALQLSKRKGELICELKNDRVELTGRAITYMIGEIFV